MEQEGVHCILYFAWKDQSAEVHCIFCMVLYIWADSTAQL